MRETLARWFECSSALVMNLRDYSSAENKKTRKAPGLVAHRGAWDASTPENTMAAFERARALGAWAIEFDVRFTRDGQAVVHHDADLRRLFGYPGKIADLTWRELTDLGVHLPRLEEVLSLKGLHFMIEVKTGLTAAQQKTLESHLQVLRPIEDYHLLSLDPGLVRVSKAFPGRAWILVGDMNVPALARAAFDQGLGGVAAHYVFVTNRWLRWLHERGLKAGAGFVPTRNLYYREWNRGLEWVFTNTLPALKTVSN
jgi:glycerophosphoryl diester phosphodiesterase